MPSSASKDHVFVLSMFKQVSLDTVNRLKPMRLSGIFVRTVFFQESCSGVSMNRQDHSVSREIIVANAISEVVAELRMVDVGDYLAFLRFEQFASIADIVESAAELYFMPGTLKLGNGGEAVVGWGEVPKIKLELELRARGATVYFTLELEDQRAGVEVNYVAFDKPSQNPDEDTHNLAAMIEYARIRKSPPPAAAGCHA